MVCAVKRFTCTGKWDDPWFWELSTPAKMLYLYLLDHCDNAGVVDCNLKLASLKIGEPVDEETVAKLGDRLQRLPNGKLHLVKFVHFQYGPTLKPGSNLHKHAITLLKGHGLPIPHKGDLVETYLRPNLDLPDPSTRGTGTGTGTGTGKEGGTGGNKRFTKPSADELKLHAAKIGLSDREVEKFWNYYESNGWRVGRNPMRSWQSAMVNWRSHANDYGTNNGKPQPMPVKGILEKETDKMRREIEKL